MNYHEHCDTIGRANRLRRQARRAEYGRILATHAESRLGVVTLFMPADDLTMRRREGRRAFHAGHRADSARVGFVEYGRRMGWTS